MEQLRLQSIDMCGMKDGVERFISPREVLGDGSCVGRQKTGRGFVVNTYCFRSRTGERGYGDVVA